MASKAPVVVPTATAVVVGTPADDEAYKVKYEKLKMRAKWLNAAAAVLLCIVSVKSFMGGTENCSPMLIKVVMCWMSAIGAVLLLAELHVEKVLAYVHVLSYRSGRALIALMAGTITLSAAPSEIPMYSAGYSQGGLYLTSVKWEFVFVGLLVIAGAGYNIRLTTRSKSHKQNKLSGQPAQSGKARELV